MLVGQPSGVLPAGLGQATHQLAFGPSAAAVAAAGAPAGGAAAALPAPMQPAAAPQQQQPQQRLADPGAPAEGQLLGAPAGAGEAAAGPVANGLVRSPKRSAGLVCIFVRLADLRDL